MKLRTAKCPAGPENECIVRSTRLAGTLLFGFVLIAASMSSALGAVGPNWIEQYGITWTFDKNLTADGAGNTYQYGTFVNGDYWIVADGGGNVTIIGIDPCSSNVGGRIKHGSQISSDIKDFDTYSKQQTMTQGFDNNMTSGANFPYAAAKNVAFEVDAGSPLVVPAGTALLSSISNDAVMRPQLKVMAILTTLSSAPAADSFRPPYAGDNRAIEWNKSDINYNPLGSVDVSGIATFPSLATCEAYFEKPWPDWKGNPDGGRNIHPSDNMPHYGQDIAQRVGVAAIMLNSDETDEAKETLMIRFLQYGIDLWGVYEANIQFAWVMDGGHGPGRKFPILFAGTILGDTTGMAAIGTHDLDDPIFGEDHTTYYLTQAECNRYMTGGDTWAEGGRYTLYDGGVANTHRNYEDAYYVAEDWDYVNPNGETGIPEYIKLGIVGPIRDCCQGRWISRRYDASYRSEQHGSSMHGFILAAHIMGLKDEWNHDALFDYIDRWMDPTTWNITGDPSAWPETYTSAWHRYGAYDGDGLPNMNAWDTYRADYGPVWPQTSGNQRPAAHAGGDQAVVDTDNNGTEQVALDGSASTDNDTIVSYVWSDNLGDAIPDGPTPTALLRTGTHIITLTVTDNDDMADTDNVTISIQQAGSEYPVWSSESTYSFDGVDDFFEIPTTNWRANSGTISLWAYAEDLSSSQYFFGHNVGTTSWSNRIQIYTVDNSLSLGLGDTHARHLNIETLSLQTWYNIALTWDGTNYAVYVDGIEKASGPYTGLTNLNTFADIGNTGNTSYRDQETFNGSIGKIRVYNRALSNNEVLELYNEGVSVPGNNPPTANNDSVIVNEDSTANVIDVLSNDTDADGDTLLIVQPVGQGSYGTVAIIGGGTGLTYTPDENYSGDDTFTYTVSDGNGGTDTATVNVSISDSNVNGLVGFWEFEEGSGLTTADSSGNGNTGTLANELMWTGFGELNFDGVDDYVDCGNDPSLNLTSNLTIAAWINPISFGQGGYGRIVDKGSSSTGFSFFLNEANNGLGYVIYGGTLVWSDASVIALNQHQYVAVVYNGFSSTITFYVDGLPVGSSNYQTNPIDSSNDPLFIGIRGYDLNRAFDGLIDDVRVYNRALSSTEIQQLYSDRPSANNPPTAGNDSATVDEDSVANVINVLANDTDADDDTLIITSVTQATHGSVAITGGGTGLAYTPTPDYNGPDSFTYTISDGQGGIDTATVSVTVTNVPDDPEAEDDSAVTDEDTDVTTGNVLTNDTDADGDTLTIDSFTQVIHGTVAYNNDGTFTYTPAANYNGNDSFDYTISDGNGGTDTATVLIDVTAINDPPDVSAIPDTLQKYEDESILPQEIELATDVDSSDTLTYTYLPDLQANDYILHVDVSDGTVTVRKDVTIIVIPVLPTVISATAATKFTVEVVFSEDLEKSSAENIDNYSIENDSLINPIVINLLELNAEGDTVTLHTTGHTETEGVFYNLTVANVQDLAENTMIGETKDYTFDDGLIGLWRFNDQAGNTAQDSSGYDNTATLVNGPVWSEQDDLNFDGTDDAVEIPTANWNVNNGTIALWAYAEDLAGIRYLFGHITDSGNDRIGLYTDEGNLNLELGDSGVVSENIENLDLQTWYHFALTWDGTNYIVYVNGGEEAWGTFSGLTDLNNFADIGNTGQISYRDNAFDGYIDDARVYNRSLSSDEVINVYLMSDESIRENKVLAFGVSATYPYGSALIYSETDPNLLVIDGASFNEKGTGTFAWNPWYDQAGTYDITFLPTDQQQPQYSQTVTVFVEDVQLSGWYQRWLEHLGLL